MAERFSQLLVVGALAAGLTSGCSSAPSPEDNIPSHIELQHDIAAYWQTVGVDVSQVELETVMPGDETDCGIWNSETGEWYNYVVESYDSTSPAMYCEKEDKIVIAALKYAEERELVKREDLDPDAFDALVMAHEFGHAVTTKVERIDPSPRAELLADCLGGQAISVFSPELAAMSALIYMDTAVLPPGDMSHGTNEERRDSFQKGAGHIYGCTIVPMEPEQ